MKHYTKVLAIAGIETLGSAGMGADIKAMSACGCFAVSALTSVVDATPNKIEHFFHLPVDVVVSQIKSVYNGLGVEAIKIGMLHSAELIHAVYNTLNVFTNRPPIVVDPVIVSTTDVQVIDDEAILAYKEGLLSLATIITPNLREARRLIQKPIVSLEEMKAAAQELGHTYHTSCIIKSGEFEGEWIDVLYDEPNDELTLFRAQKVDTPNKNGTGCSLSSSIASYLARGEKLKDAVSHAKTYLNAAVASGAEFDFSGGNGPINHFVFGAPTPFEHKVN